MHKCFVLTVALIQYTSKTFKIIKKLLEKIFVVFYSTWQDARQQKVGYG